MKVALLNPSGPGFAGLTGEECCFSSSPEPVPLNSPLTGIASALHRREHEIVWARTPGDVPVDSDCVVQLVVSPYETFSKQVGKWVLQRTPKAQHVAICIPPGLAEVLDRETVLPWHNVVGYDSTRAALRLMGIEEPSSFVPFTREAFAPWRQGSWIWSGSSCKDRCSYCSWGNGLPLELREPENLILSLEEMHGSGSPVVDEPSYIVCSEMNCEKRWMKEIADLKEQSKVADRKIITDIRADWLTAEQIELLGRMKTFEVIAALETPNPAILKYVNRHMDPLKMAAGYKMLRDAGIRVNCPVMFGLHEDEDPEEYAAFCAKYEIVPNPGLAKAHPGVGLWKMAREGNFPTELYREWPEPADPVLVRRPVAASLAKLQKFKDLMGLK